MRLLQIKIFDWVVLSWGKFDLVVLFSTSNERDDRHSVIAKVSSFYLWLRALQYFTVVLILVITGITVVKK